MSKAEEAKAELLKGIKCLFLELPEPVAIDVKRRVDNYIAAVEEYASSHWGSVEDKRYLLIDGNAYYSLVFDQWNDGDFEAENIDGSYRVLISKNDTGYFVANAMDGWGNNSKDHFKDSKVILLNPISTPPTKSSSGIEQGD